MCGIFGIIFSEHRTDLGKILLQAGRRLTYRGYDSVGVAVFDNTLISAQPKGSSSSSLSLSDSDAFAPDSASISSSLPSPLPPAQQQVQPPPLPKLHPLSHPDSSSFSSSPAPPSSVSSGDRITLAKDVGEIEEVNSRLKFDRLGGYKGIIQLRWATFGVPSRANAQPHFDCTNRLVGAHNGNIVNTKELIQSFTEKGHTFHGENDGEVIVHVVEDCLNQARCLAKSKAKPEEELKKDLVKGHKEELKSDGAADYKAERPENPEADRAEDLKSKLDEELKGKRGSDDSMNAAIRMAARILKGDYAYAISAQDTNRMFCVKKYSSLYLGVGKDFVCCSSDLPSIIPLTRRIVSIYDGEYVEFGAGGFIIRKLETGEVIERPPHTVELDIEQACKDPYPHFMLKEIYEQPEKTAALLRFLKESGQTANFIQSLNQALRGGKLFLVGSGTSYNACMLGASYLNKIAGIEAVPVIAGAFKESFGEADFSRSVCILVSQSGETKDVISVLNFLEEKGAPHTFALVNVLGSSLQLRVKNYLPLLSNIEISVPATKTFTNQALIFLFLALKLGDLRKRPVPGLEEEISRIPELVRRTLEEAGEACRRMAPILAHRQYLYYLGYGISFGACLEGALKMKEITYIPCEAMYSSEFKHGPLAIISPGDWVIFLATKEDAYMTLSHINEISCRGGKILTIAPPEESLEGSSHEFVALPAGNYYLSPLLGTIVAQKLAYFVSQEKGINPDQPRNISKTLTVD